MANDDHILTTMRFIPQHKVVQKYSAILPDNLTNQAMKESEAYKTYYGLATRKVIPKPNSHASSSGADEGTSVIPGFSDVPTYGSEDKHISWNLSDNEDDDEVRKSKDVGIKRLLDDLRVTADKMIDYSLWEVIENGNAPRITKVVKGVETTIAPATAKEKAQRRLELKAEHLLMGILMNINWKVDSRWLNVVLITLITISSCIVKSRKGLRTPMMQRRQRKHSIKSKDRRKERQVSDSEEEDVPQAKIQKKTVKPSFAKIEFVKSKEQVKSPRKTTVKQGNQNRLDTHSPRGNQRNWNNMMSQRLGSNFEMINKAYYVCGSFDHLQYDCNNHQR
ncbi:hypothetical protein Tco_0371417 [Tanacetum coccineum]